MPLRASKTIIADRQSLTELNAFRSQSGMLNYSVDNTIAEWFIFISTATKSLLFPQFEL